MMFNEIKSGDIPCLSFLKGTRYAMYVGPELTPGQREKLKSEDVPVPVIYLPEILEQLSEAVVKYNFPGVTMPESLTVETIYAQIRAEFDGRITPESRLIVKYNGDVLVIYDAKDSFDLVISYLINVCKPLPSPSLRQPSPCLKLRFKKLGSKINEAWGGLYDELEEPGKISEYDTCSSLDSEMANALNEVQEKIQNLLLNGCSPELILSLINQSVKLSRIRISKQLKIFLVDYDNVEIKMGPLPKTVFLFYLRHPEGVMFSHLQNYRDELLGIYGHVCTNDDPQKMEESIDRLIDPLDNSICEKVAAVKKAFILQISDTIAKNYYINGSQGSKKRISLNRSLIEWECEL